VGGDKTSVEDFPQKAPELLAGIRKCISELSRARETVAVQQALGDLLEEVGAFKLEAGQGVTLPAWKMACALQGLIKEVTEKPASMTPSTLRTIAGAVDLLHTLSARGIPPQLASDPPVRLMAVDDDAICRHAVSFALKKSLATADTAGNGEQALLLAETQSYDAIFLDVEMPGMDGFELCSRIHTTSLNRTTPIVFVTSRSDFEARSRSLLIGGQDLVSKPFLSFELTVKALTAVLRGRLQMQQAGANRARPKAPTAGVVDSLARGETQQTEAAPTFSGTEVPVAAGVGASV
jgi:CheY-like chemotaxis protein